MVLILNFESKTILNLESNTDRVKSSTHQPTLWIDQRGYGGTRFACKLNCYWVEDMISSVFQCMKRERRKSCINFGEILTISIKVVYHFPVTFGMPKAH